MEENDHVKTALQKKAKSNKLTIPLVYIWPSTTICPHQFWGHQNVGNKIGKHRSLFQEYPGHGTSCHGWFEAGITILKSTRRHLALGRWACSVALTKHESKHKFRHSPHKTGYFLNLISLRGLLPFKISSLSHKIELYSAFSPSTSFPS